MKSILHISDIHFGGAQSPNWAEAVIEEVTALKPALVAVSGDLTQRARTAQFRQARAFIDRLVAPVIVVPGNHDVPLWNLFNRFFSPLEKYRQWITDDLNPVYSDDEMFVMGLDTTRSFTIKGGSIGSGDLERVRARMCDLPADRLKVLVGHHPLVQPPGFEHEDTVRGVRRALKLFGACGVDMVLTGHMHQSHVSLHTHSSRGILLVQAGTAASLRGRGHEHQKNSFNLIEVAGPEITITSYVYSSERARFIASESSVWPRH
jgi:3',5'-cyclic AMP phosphodiesterase CpdA